MKGPHRHPPVRVGSLRRGPQAQRIRLTGPADGEGHPERWAGFGDALHTLKFFECWGCLAEVAVMSATNVSRRKEKGQTAVDRVGY